MEKSDGNSSHLYVLQDMYRQYRETMLAYRAQGRGFTAEDRLRFIIWGPYMWRTVYLLNRLRQPCRISSSDEISALIEILERNSFANIEQVGLAARVGLKPTCAKHKTIQTEGSYYE